MRAKAAMVFLILVTVWAGIVIGVSMIATPVKFQAPSLTMQTGVEIGRYTFRFLAQIELCFLVAAIAVAGLAQPRPITIGLLALIVVTIVMQRYWLWPILDHRVSQILAGALPSSSICHRVYAAMEAAKATLLITVAVVEYR